MARGRRCSSSSPASSCPTPCCSAGYTLSVCPTFLLQRARSAGAAIPRVDRSSSCLLGIASYAASRSPEYDGHPPSRRPPGVSRTRVIYGPSARWLNPVYGGWPRVPVLRPHRIDARIGRGADQPSGLADHSLRSMPPLHADGPAPRCGSFLADADPTCSLFCGGRVDVQVADRTSGVFGTGHPRHTGSPSQTWRMAYCRSRSGWANR